METLLENQLLARQVDGLSVVADRSDFAIARSATMLGLATACVAMRFWCRSLRGAKYERDDWMLLAALVSTYEVDFTASMSRHGSLKL